MLMNNDTLNLGKEAASHLVCLNESSPYHID